MLTDYWRNKLMDANVRAQAITFPATRYLALFTVAPTSATGGTEVVVSGYGRISLASSLANWSGTQGDGTTSASSGTTGRITNNVTVQFEDSATVAWDGVVAWGEFDASTSGNLLEFGYLVDAVGSPITRSFSIGDLVEFAPGALVRTWT